MDIPQTYFLQKFYQHGYKVSKSGNEYVSCCPYCREGKHWGTKKRLYYMPVENYLWCHNCSTRWTPYWWLREVAGMDYSEIIKEMEEMGISEDDFYYERVEFTKEEKKIIPDLPLNSVNLLDPIQWEYHKHIPIFQTAKRFMNRRRLITAVNRPAAYYLSVNDPKHRNRLTIPYYGDRNNIIYYQSRALEKSDEELGKYFFKLGAEHKELFNLDKISNEVDRVYIFEGALDCIFLPNGISCGGIQVTSYQKEVLQKYSLFHDIVYVFDNPLFDKAATEKMVKLIDENEKVFLWGGEFSKYKDFSEMAEKNKIDCIDPKNVDQYVFSGEQAKNQLRRLRSK